ncbi:MAG: V-type ATP synthase subunit D [Candidatus Omnitrophica bacterium]|nr:V-type ATP synthase subunit D [Candidatus Omnitrophota bacterium]
MAKIKLTKSELKRQKEEEKRFTRYLPMLQLKKQQLQVEILKIHRGIDSLALQIDDLRSQIVVWVDVFAQDVELMRILKIKEIKTEVGNIAGIDIPVFLEVEFDVTEYDFLTMPLWVDKGIEVCKKEIELKAQIAIYHKQAQMLKNELRVTTQRVNLFEKVKIPQARENIRVINIYTGEIQKAGVVRGKIAKAKIAKQNM